ncbi:SRR1-like protein [Sycon ciliatum]|uniref:SRR1-like protein n=1 Tax=Sycon ciliatum TaxID=27933 RepID=UPI0031F630CF
MYVFCVLAWRILFLAMEEDGFQLVCRKKAARSRKVENKRFPVDDTETWDEAELRACKSRLDIARDELRASKFMTGFQAKLDTLISIWTTAKLLGTNPAPATGGGCDQDATKGTEHEPGRIDVVCYGIGPFAQSLQARHQMGALMLLVKYLQDRHLLQDRFLYDPVLQRGEADIVQELGFELIKVNEEGRRRVVRPTLFFMPHCGRSLYENVLASNWSCKQLHFVAIIGNEFSSYLHRMPTHVFRSETPHLAHGQSIVSELEILPGEFMESFNDSALHVFDQHKLPAEGDAFWTCSVGSFQDDDHVSSQQLSGWRWAT